MQPIIVVGPDGAENEFPAGTPDTVIEGAMKQHYSAAPSQPAPDQPAQPHTLMQKIGHGMADIGYGLGELMAHNTPSSSYAPLPMTTGIGGPSQDQRKQSGLLASNEIAGRENTWQGERAASGDTGTEWARLGGQALAAAPVMAMMPSGAGFLGGAAAGAGQGAAAALLQPVGKAESYNTAKLGQVKEGTTSGAVAGGLLGWLGSKAKGGDDSVYRDAVNYLRDRDVTPTIGQNIGKTAATWEDRMSTVNLNVPGAQRKALESFNVGALNEALQPLGVKYDGPVGRDAFKKVSGVVDKAYDTIKQNISLPVPDEMRTKIGAIVSDAATPDPTIAETVNRILDKALYSYVDDNNVLSGAAFKSAEEALGKYAKRYGGETSTAHERAIGEALTGVQGALRDALEEANPQFADHLRATNRAYAILARLQKAVPATDPDGLFTPARLAMAVKQADNTVRDRAYTQGDALLQKYSDAGLRVLGNKYPDSGTAGRQMTANILEWPVQAGVSALTAPAYSKAGQQLLGGAIDVGSDVTGLLGSVAKKGQKLVPYALPGLLGK